jgi:hypothetical protein
MPKVTGPQVSIMDNNFPLYDDKEVAGSVSQQWTNAGDNKQPDRKASGMLCYRQVYK